MQHNNSQSYWQLLWSAWCLLSIDALFVDKQLILATTAWCAILQLWWIWLIYTRLPQQDSSFRNTIQPRQVLFQAMIHLHPNGYITTTHNRHRHGRHFNQSQSQQNSHHDMSNSSYRRHTLCSWSSHHSGLHYPSANRCLHCHLCLNTPHRHSHTPSKTHHFSYWHHSDHYSMDHSQSHSSNSHCTVWLPQLMKKAKPHPRPSSSHKSHHSKTVIIQDSPSDSFSDSDNDTDSLNY